jgi:hypothetical protein
MALDVTVSTKETESWLDRIMQPEESHESMLMILSRYDSVFLVAALARCETSALVTLYHGFQPDRH